MSGDPRLPLRLVLSSLVAVMVVGGWCWWRVEAAQAQADAALDQARGIARDVQRVQALRLQTQAVSDRRRPDADLVTRAQRALSQAGLPVTACSGVQPRTDQHRPGGGIRIQTVQLSLRALRPGDLGAWLTAWSAAEPAWTVSEIQLAHQPTTAPSLDSNRFDVSVVLSAPYVEDTP